MNGALVPADDASVSVHDRRFLYGDGITERLRVYNGQVFAYNAHEKRIEAGCEVLSIPVPEALPERIEATLSANGLTEAVLTVTISRGGGPEFTPALDADPMVVIAVERAPHGGRRPANGSGERDNAPSAPSNRTPIRSADPVTLQTVTVRRSAGIDPFAERSTRLRARLELARAATETHRADEALVRDDRGFVTGATTADLCFVAENALRVSNADPIDVCRPVVRDLAREEGIPIETGDYRPSTVREASEAFLVSATRGFRPVGSLDGIAIGDGPVRRLLELTFGELLDERYY